MRYEHIRLDGLSFTGESHRKTLLPEQPLYNNNNDNDTHIYHTIIYIYYNMQHAYVQRPSSLRVHRVFARKQSHRNAFRFSHYPRCLDDN